MRFHIPLVVSTLVLSTTLACSLDEPSLAELRAEDELDGPASDPLEAIPVDDCRRFRSLGGDCLSGPSDGEPDSPPRAPSTSDPDPDPILVLAEPLPEPEPAPEPTCEIVTGDPIILWPPSHKPEAFSVSDCVVALEGCGDGDIDIDEAVEIVSLSSDEYENGKGDGNTCADTIMITSASTFEVRSERSGGGDGRVYTIEMRYLDDAEVASYATCQIVVPTGHNVPAVDSGCQLCLDADLDEIDHCDSCAYTSQDC